MLTGLLGGALIGLATSLLWFGTRRVAGVSGLVREAVTGQGERGLALAFLVGLVAAGAAAAVIQGHVPRAVASWPVMVVAGLLVGYGTALSNGCTSGHGVCGLSRFSRRSLVATVVFIAAGAAMVLAVRLLGGGA